MNLKQKIVKSVFWISAIRLLNRLSAVISSLILTRFLSPDDFGVVTIGLLVISLLRILTEFGFSKSLIQKQDITESHINTAWTIEILKGVVLSTIIYVLAPVLVRFFERPSALLIVRVMGVIPILSAITNIRLFLFEKELEFSRIFLLESCTLIANLVISIFLAVWLQNAWALVGGQLALYILRLVISYLYFPYPPDFQLSRRHFSDLYVLGKWIFIGGIVSYFVMEGDKYIVGKYLGVSSLGLYKMAYLISNLIVNETKSSIGRVLFPVYAKLQDEGSNYKHSILRSYAATFFLIAPVTLGMSFVSDDLVHYFFNTKWQQIDTILPVLAIAAFLRGISVACTGSFLGSGKASMPALFSLSRLVVFISAVFWLIQRYGLPGVGYALILSNLIVAGFMIIGLNSHFKISISQLLLANGSTLTSLISMVMGIELIRYLYAPSLFRLTFSVFVGASIYMVTSYILRNVFKTNPLMEILRSVTKSKLSMNNI